MPGYILLAEILGVKPGAPGFSRIAVRPRIDLLARAKGFVPLAAGGVGVEWERTSASEARLRVENMTGAPTVVGLPPGWGRSLPGASEIPMGPYSVLDVVIHPR